MVSTALDQPQAQTQSKTYGPEARRGELLSASSPRYHAGAHFFGLMAIASGLLFGALWLVDSPSILELSIVPLGFVVANVFEWALHKGPMHELLVPKILYQRHTLIHHVVYTHEVMEIGAWAELRYVMFPLWALPLYAVVILPVPLALWWLWSLNAAAIVFATVIAYYMVYEWCHVAYHLPSAHPVRRLRLVEWLRRHHQRHHDPKQMNKGNFNVSFPLCDWLMGTVLPPK